jgi:ketosteroid isomerase-like protein
MQIPQILLLRLLSNQANRAGKRLLTSLLGFAIGCACVLSAGITQAASPETAPPELKNLLSEIDAAANRQDIDAVMNFYSASLTHADGLSYETLKESLTNLWQRYPELTYQTQLVSWETEGNGIVAETVTNITGTEAMKDRTLNLTATLRSRQRYENQKIVEQEILSEETKLNTGSSSPTLDLKLPEQIKAGQQFTFDAIVTEPLGESLLMGAAVEEAIKPDNYLKPATVELEPLPAGGIFKVGRAPTTPSDRWLSAIVVHKDGISMVTKRLNIE